MLIVFQKKKERISMVETNDGIKFAYLGFIICSLITAAVACYVYISSETAGVIVIVGSLSAIAWFSTRRSWSRVQDNILVVYLFTVMGILAQNIEEWSLGLSKSAIFGNHVHFAFYSIGLATLFVFGSMGLTYKNSLGIFMTWFLFIWAIIQGVAHYVYPILSTGKFYYVPGQVISLIPILLGGYGIKKLLSFRRGKGGVKNEKR
jgi:hypothetical protein